MPAGRHFSRVDVLELKSQIESKLGRQKAAEYFNLLTNFLSFKVGKSDFDRLCIDTVGRENVCLHNLLLRSIITNAHLSRTPPPKQGKKEGTLGVKVPNGFQRSSLQSLCKDFPQSPRKGRTPTIFDRKFRDRPSSLGPHGKGHAIAFEDSVHKNQEQQSATELHSLGGRPPGSVEDGEEVDQATGSPGIHSRSPVRAPLGIPLNVKGTKKLLSNRLATSHESETCHYFGELPDTGSLRRKLQQKLEIEKLNVSVDCANLLNNSLDLYLKRLIKHCFDLTNSRSGQKHSDQERGCAIRSLKGRLPEKHAPKTNEYISASLLDFLVAMELNPSILGEEWPMQLEKISLRALEQ